VYVAGAVIIILGATVVQGRRNRLRQSGPLWVGVPWIRRRVQQSVTARTVVTIPNPPGPLIHCHAACPRAWSIRTHHNAGWTEADMIHSFELRRHIDDLVYTFDRIADASGQSGFQRRDRPDLWIIYRPDQGWVAIQPEDGGISGRPWSVPPSDQDTTSPPEGVWVSRKDDRSYVYSLVYL
jgi:hypothetical protein